MRESSNLSSGPLVAVSRYCEKARKCFFEGESPSEKWPRSSRFPRTATVQCLTPVDVMTMTRIDFVRLLSTYGAMRKLVEDDMAVLAVSDKGL